MAQEFTSYSVDNDRKFRESLKEASKVSQDFRVPFGLISADFYKSEQAIFKLKSAGKYPPFKGVINPKTGHTPYQDRKLRKYGFDYPLLVRTGALANSMLGPSNKGSVNVRGPLSLTIGTTIAYGVYHQSDEGRDKIPLRKFIFIGPEAPRFATSEQQGRLERWLGIMSDFINREMKKQLGNQK